MRLKRAATTFSVAATGASGTGIRQGSTDVLRARHERLKDQLQGALLALLHLTSLLRS